MSVFEEESDDFDFLMKIQYTLFYKNNFIRTQGLKSERKTMGRTIAFCLEQRKI